MMKHDPNTHLEAGICLVCIVHRSRLWHTKAKSQTIFLRRKTGSLMGRFVFQLQCKDSSNVYSVLRMQRGLRMQRPPRSTVPGNHPCCKHMVL